MKYSKKFMVVPYEEKKIEVLNKSTDTKISEILNNQKIDKDDKVKLVNQILIQSQNKKILNAPPSNQNVNESFDTSHQDTIDNNDYTYQANSNFNETINNKTRVPIVNRADVKLNSTINNKNNKSHQDTPIDRNQTIKAPILNLNNRTLIQVNKKLDKLNDSLKSGYLNLAPAYSTRHNTKNFIEKADEISIPRKISIPKRKKRLSNSLLETNYQKVRKTNNKNSPFEESTIEDMDTAEKIHTGKGWSFYKK